VVTSQFEILGMGLIFILLLGVRCLG